MKKINLLIFAILTLSVITSSCSDNLTNQPQEITQSNYLINQCVFKLPPTLNDSNVYGYISISALDMFLKNGYYKNDLLYKLNICTVEFSKDGKSCLNGDILFNGDTMLSEGISPDCEGCNSVQYIYEKGFDSVLYKGQIFTINCLGDPYNQPIVVRIQVPKSNSKIISPEPCSYIKIQDSLVISWDGEHQPGLNLVKIIVTNSVTRYDKSLIYYPEDTGNFLIPQEALSSLAQSKDLEISLYIGRNLITEYYNGKYIYTEVYSCYQTNYMFAN